MDQAHPAELRPPSGVGRVHPSLLQRCPEGLKPAPPTPASFGPRRCGDQKGRGRRDQAHHSMSLSSRVTRLARVMLLAHLLAGALVIALENHLPGRPIFRSDEKGNTDDPALPARSQARGSDLDVAVPLCSRDVPSCGGWACQFQGRATQLCVPDPMAAVRPLTPCNRAFRHDRPWIVFRSAGRGAEGFRRH